MSESDKNLTQVQTAIEKLGSNKAVALKDVLALVAPPVPALPVPAKLPVPAVITDKQKAALNKLPKVFGLAVPDERRELTPEEVVSLVDEKQTFDEIDKLSKTRKESIRTTLFNHWDVEAESQGIPEGTERDKDGHYILAAETPVPEREKRWTRQLGEKAPTLDADALQELIDDPDVDFTKEDYLSMTVQTRVFDENKAMLALKKNPKLVAAIARATKPGGKTASLYLR